MHGRILFLLVLPCVVAFSSLGIFLIEGHGDSAYSSLFNSLWWTVVTFTTVGYGDMYPVTVEGKVFGIWVLCLGVLINSIVISFVSNWFFALKSSRAQGLKEVNLDDHILVCSDSPVFIYSVLSENKSFVEGHKAVIVTPLERHPLLGSKFETVPWVHGDAYVIDVLKKASAQDGKIAYVSFEDDADTVMAVMQLEVLSPGGVIQTMARYRIQDFRNHLMNVGCDYAIKTYDVYVPLMVQSSISQGAPVWIREIILTLSNTPTIRSKDLHESFVDRTWLEYIAEVKTKAGEMPLGLINPEGKLQVNPSADTRLAAKSRVLSMVPHRAGSRGDTLGEGQSFMGFEDIGSEGHIVVCSDEASFIGRILIELELAKVPGKIVVLSKLDPFRDKIGHPRVEWIQAKSYSDYGLEKANAANARIAFIDHERDSHTLMAVLRLETITQGKIFSVASYREPGFDERLLGVGCDYCINVDELIAPILYQNAIHHGIGNLIEQIISHQPQSESLSVVKLSDKWNERTWIKTVLKLKERFGILPVGLITENGAKMLTNPDPEVVVKPTDSLIFIARTGLNIDLPIFENI